jgi:UDP-N-acetylglucosamine diphosphorylase/glucosamine-1-phosphate N-acetyltransferase
VTIPPCPSVTLLGEEIVYAFLEPTHLADCTTETIDLCLEHWKSSLPTIPAVGSLMRHGWDLIERNAEQLCRDAPFFEQTRTDPSLTVVGPRERLHIATARVEPMVLLDTTKGPIVVDREAIVTAFSRLEGPCYVGPRSQVHGARLRGGVTLGPDCRIGGELEASIVHGRSNKAHDGFLGHSYVGEWVNLGAGTQNSDLRNDYGEVTVTIAGRRVATGMTKAGCLIGDHTKSGLGTLLNTGANIGAFCNLLPGGLLPRYMPSFCSWWNAALAANDDFAPLLETAQVVMARRGVTLTAVHAALYRHLHEQTTAERSRVLRDAEVRRLRRSA